MVTLESWPGEHCTKALSAVPLSAASAQKGAFYPPRRSGFFSNFHKVLQGPGLLNCDKEPTFDSLGVPANSSLSPEPATMPSPILRGHLSQLQAPP